MGPPSPRPHPQSLKWEIALLVCWAVPLLLLGEPHPLQAREEEESVPFQVPRSLVQEPIREIKKNLINTDEEELKAFRYK